ncbi:MAG: MarR family winged helix-turn-helix transcriptional regulator [Peptococcaceae bacterium]
MFAFRESMGFLLGRTNQKLINRLSRELREYNITPEQWALLNLLMDEDGILQKELSVKSGKDQTTITRALDNLNKKNYIERCSSPNDRRAFLIYLTDEGRGLMERLVPIAKNLLNEIFKGFSQKEINELKSLLDKLYEAIE